MGWTARNDIYGDSGEPLADQWIYHAVADTILANSLLRSFPEVDSEKIGLMGISWGGVIASTVIGIDGRFAFAIPTYGCGAMADADNQYGRALKENALYRNVWDPVNYLPGAKMPVLWFTWLKDPHFPLTSQSACYRVAAGPCMVAVLKDMKHSHSAGWNPADSYAFAESVVRDGKPWLRQIDQRQKQDTAFAEFASREANRSRNAFFHIRCRFYRGAQMGGNTRDTEKRDGLVRISAPLADKTRAWFFNLYTGDLTASSQFVEVAP